MENSEEHVASRTVARESIIPTVTKTYTDRVVWTKALDAYLRACIRQGRTHSFIAAKLGITRNAVIGRVYRMKRNNTI